MATSSDSRYKVSFFAGLDLYAPTVVHAAAEEFTRLLRNLVWCWARMNKRVFLNWWQAPAAGRLTITSAGYTDAFWVIGEMSSGRERLQLDSFGDDLTIKMTVYKRDMTTVQGSSVNHTHAASMTRQTSTYTGVTFSSFTALIEVKKGVGNGDLKGVRVKELIIQASDL